VLVTAPFWVVPAFRDLSGVLTARVALGFLPFWSKRLMKSPLVVVASTSLATKFPPTAEIHQAIRRHTSALHTARRAAFINFHSFFKSSFVAASFKA